MRYDRRGVVSLQARRPLEGAQTRGVNVLRRGWPRGSRPLPTCILTCGLRSESSTFLYGSTGAHLRRLDDQFTILPRSRHTLETIRRARAQPKWDQIRKGPAAMIWPLAGPIAITHVLTSYRVWAAFEFSAAARQKKVNCAQRQARRCPSLILHACDMPFASRSTLDVVCSVPTLFPRNR